MRRETPFADIVRHLTPFFVSRQVIAGAGRVGLGQDGTGVGFQVSQRADFFEVEVGLETTLKRPIINTRDEPHASADRFRRLHVIIGDANLCEVADLPQGRHHGARARAHRGEGLHRATCGSTGRWPRLHAVSHDPTLQTTAAAAGRAPADRRPAAVDVPGAGAHLSRDRYGSDLDPVTAEVLARWESVLARLEKDPADCARELDWVAKQRLLEGFRQRENLPWDAARLQLIDLQWADVRPEKGLYHRLVARGQVDRIVIATPRSSGPSRSRRRTPAPTSGAAAWPSTASTWRRPRGTR